MADAAPMTEDLEPTQRGFLAGDGRTALAFARWEHSAPRGRVVLSHGYGEHSERYRHTARWLHGLGWSVSAMDHRGFGRSGGRRGDASGIRAFVEDLALFLRQERRYDAERRGAAPAAPQVLLGHSFGGLLAALDLLWFPDTLDGLLLTSPAVTLRPPGPWLRLAHGLLCLAAPHFLLELPTDKALVCSDPGMVRRYWDDPLCHRRASAAFASAMAQGRRELLPFGRALERPILLLEAGDDAIVDPDGSEELWRAVRPGFLERHRLEGFKHEILHDLRRAEAQAIAEAWLNRMLEHRPGNPKVLPDTSMKDTKETQ
ncbi:MAG TPA: alpha/beta fold hydrolase [Holophaga sp.]|nr:alpha/beta fold hydrolase [Holophaga sp.]HPS68365.1 alpha/beta fold hydrolase [Holophaga sp.]